MKEQEQFRKNLWRLTPLQNDCILLKNVFMKREKLNIADKGFYLYMKKRDFLHQKKNYYVIS